MARLGMLLFLITLALLVFALIDCLSTDPHEIRGLPRAAWAVLIVVLPVLGPIWWYYSGRPPREGTTGVRRAGNGGTPWPTRPKQVAPDDNPEFLRQLQDRARREDNESLRRWEEDLKRREDEPKDKPDEDGA
jgi:hypothetical protein